MRVKPSRSRRNINFDDGLIRAIDPDQPQIERELRQINRPGYYLRTLDLEVSLAKIQGGIEAAKAKRAEQKKLFIDWLSQLEKQRGHGDHLADQIVNYSKFLFSSHDPVLNPFKSLLRELYGIAQCNQRVRNNIMRRRLLKTLPADSKILTAELHLAAKKAGLTLEEVEAMFGTSLEWLRLAEKEDKKQEKEKKQPKQPITPEQKKQILQVITRLQAPWGPR